MSYSLNKLDCNYKCLLLSIEPIHRNKIRGLYAIVNHSRCEIKINRWDYRRHHEIFSPSCETVYHYKLAKGQRTKQIIDELQVTRSQLYCNIMQTLWDSSSLHGCNIIDIGQFIRQQDQFLCLPTKHCVCYDERILPGTVIQQLQPLLID